MGGASALNSGGEDQGQSQESSEDVNFENLFFKEILLIYF